MIYNQKKLKTIFKKSICTINMYLCRAEFSHIKKAQLNNETIYLNITLDDIKKIKQIMGRGFNSHRGRIK